MTVHPIPEGLYCVPSVLCALTGDDPESVIVPAINRHAGERTLLDAPSGVTMRVAQRVLEERGYRVRPYVGGASGPLRATVATWAERSRRWPGRTTLIATNAHALVVADGRVYDNHARFGAPSSDHPFRRRMVVSAFLVEMG
jgi:hypothetical protein